MAAKISVNNARTADTPVEDSYRDEVGNDIGMVHGHRGVEVVSVQRLEQRRRDLPWCRSRGAGHGSPSASTG
jgi:hypothetical protein